MSFQEVEGLLGDPNNKMRYGTPIRVPNQGCVEDWIGNAGTIVLYYDQDGRVVEKEWDSARRKRSLFDEIGDYVIGRQQIRE
jgi:hypothetical protein